MNIETDPKKIKRKIYMTYFQDGLWDMVLGIFLLGWGFSIMFELTWLPGASFVAVFWIALGLKQKITYPRIGYARTPENRKQMSRFVIAGIVILFLGIFLFLVIISTGMPQFLRDNFELIFGSMLAIVIGLIGYWWGISRWYAYAALVFISAAWNRWLGLSFDLSFIIPGGVVLLCGLFILVRFLRKYPVVREEEFDGRR